MFFKQLLVLAVVACMAQKISATDKVICYYSSWAAYREGNGKTLPEDMDPNLCTHINYAFLTINADGTLAFMDQELDIDEGHVQRISELKKINPNLKVLFSVGGWSAGTAIFISVATDPTLRANFVQSCIENMQKYNYDGIDIDWEFPLDASQFNVLLQALKSGFQANGYLLTAAVASDSSVAGYDIPTMSQTLDIINVMTYDFHSSGAPNTGQNSPLYASSLDGDWQRDNLNVAACIQQWITKGAAPEKVALGIATYGRSFVLTDPSNTALGAPANGPGPKQPYTAEMGIVGYNEICELWSDANIQWDDEQKNPFLSKDGIWVGYDNVESVGLKAQYAVDNKLAGVLVWTANMDDVHGACGQKFPLISKLKEIIN